MARSGNASDWQRRLAAQRQDEERLARERKEREREKEKARQLEYVEAEQVHRQTLELRRKVLGPEHPDTLKCMSELGLALSSQR